MQKQETTNKPQRVTSEPQRATNGSQSIQTKSRKRNNINTGAYIIFSLIIIAEIVVIFFMNSGKEKPKAVFVSNDIGIVTEKRDYVEDNNDVYELICDFTDKNDKVTKEIIRVTPMTFEKYNIGDEFNKAEHTK